MANDPGATTWLGDQYQRFLDGLERAGTPNAPKLIRAQSGSLADPGKAPRISVPEWDQVIRVGPRPVVTGEDWAVQKAAERAGVPSPLDPVLQQAIADRRAIADRIRNSAIPEYQRGVTDMLTAVDNVQDAALTASVAGELGVAATGRFGQFLAPAVAALGRLALALNWLGLATFLFGVGYNFVCRGPRGAAAAASIPALVAPLFRGLRAIAPRLSGLPVPIPAPRLKGRAGAAMFSIPSGRVPDYARGSRWARALPGFAELLQVAQTAADWTGYGLSLGAVMGAAGEVAYSGIRKSQGESVTVRSPRAGHLYGELVGPRLAGVSRAALWHREQCARCLVSAPLILRDPVTFGDEMYALTWVAVYMSLEPLMWDTEGLPWREQMIDHLGAEWTPPEPRDPVTRGILEELGVQGAASGAWPIVGSPRALSAERLVTELGPEIARRLEAWLDEAPSAPERRFVAELSMRVTERLWWWLEGADDMPQWKLAPPTAVWESLFQASRWPVVSDPPDAIMRAWLASEEYVRTTGRAMIDQEVLDRIWTEAGSPLLRLRGGDGELPVAFDLPHDPDTGIPPPASAAPTLAEARRLLAEQLQAAPRAEGEPSSGR